ncbi:MAG: threonine/serine exporter family protein [Planctomycetota bacterium]|jgi:uncharacterized membrane protein YjjP (DUF1212 family)
MNNPTNQTSNHGRAEKEFLLLVAELLHAYGTPAYRLERVLAKVAQSLGVESSYMSTPTAIMVSFGSGASTMTHLIRVDPGEVNLGKLVEFDEIMEDVEHGRLPVAEATRKLRALADVPFRYGTLEASLACGAASGATACLFHGGWPEIALSFVIGAGIGLLGRLLTRKANAVGLLEPASAFLAAMIAMMFSRFVYPLDDRLVTLSSLIVLVPGLTITTALTELTMRHLVSGVARLAGAVAVLFTMVFGVALAWRLGDVWMAGAVDAVEHGALSSWPTMGVALVLPIAFAVVLEVRCHEMGVVFLAGALGYVMASMVSSALGPDYGSFMGSLTIGLLSNMYARMARRPGILPMTPGILMLVPGSLGFRSLASFVDSEAMAGLDWAFQAGMVAASLVAGILVANLMLPPRRVM